MSLADARVRSAAIASELTPLGTAAPYVTAGTITIPIGSKTGASPVISGLSQNSVVSVTYVSGSDNGATVVFDTIISSPTPAGPQITVDTAAVAVVHALKFSYIVFAL